MPANNISLNASNVLAIIGFGGYVPALKLIGFFLIGSLAAGFVAALDIASKDEEPGVIMRTREWLLLLISNAIVALALAYGAFKLSRLDLSFFGLITIIFGYPLLMHSKIFSFQDAGENKPIGLEIFLQTSETILKPGMNDSKGDQKDKLQEKWDEIDINKMGRFAKVYFNNHASDQERQSLCDFVDKTVNDIKDNPKRLDGGRLLIFNAVYKMGKQRGLRTIIKRCNGKSWISNWI